MRDFIAKISLTALFVLAIFSASAAEKVTFEANSPLTVAVGEPFRVELRAPDGSLWTWGPAEAAQRVTGSAEDFCCLVTQRRPLRELDVPASGEDAARWLPIAQAFAGPPGTGR